MFLDKNTSNINRVETRSIKPMIGAMLAICVLAIGLTFDFEKVPEILKRGLQPSDFPQLITCLLILLLAVELVFEKKTNFIRQTKRYWKTLLLFLVFVALVPLDFFLALAIFSGCLSLLWGERRVIILLSLVVILPLSIFLLFDLVFSIRFPEGVLTSMWYQ